MCHAFFVYGQQRYERLSKLSVSHLHNLRKSGDYRAFRSHLTKTRAVCTPMGVREALRPNGRAGWVRIDSVNQGDLDGIEGVYHNTCLDSVSQRQVQACVQSISEAFIGVVLWEINRGFQFAETCAVMLINIVTVGIIDLVSARIRQFFV